MTGLIKEDLLDLKLKMEMVESDFTSRLRNLEQKESIHLENDKKIELIVKEKGNNFITVNVGGKNFKVKLSTLIKCKDSYFYIMFVKLLLQTDEIPNFIFIDRNYTYFALILDYLRHEKLSLVGYNKVQREDIKDEMNFYGLELFKRGSNEIEIEWDQKLSKNGNCTVDQLDSRNLRVHSNSCYCHFLTNKLFTTENFIIEFESNVTQTDNYFYFGIINQSYSTEGNCMCCNPTNSYFIKCDGTIHINGVTHASNLSWYGNSVTIGMKVLLSEQVIYFYKDSPDNEVGPYTILAANNFRVVSAHCNTGSGNIAIKTCYEI